MERITRSTLIAVCELLGLDPSDTHEIRIEPHTIDVTRRMAIVPDVDEEG